MKHTKKHTYDNGAIFRHIENKAKPDGLPKIKIFELSAQLDMTPTTFSQLKNGNRDVRNCRRQTLEKIAGYTGLTLSDVYKICGITVSKKIDTVSDSALYLRHMREQLGLTKQGASYYFGLGKNSFSFFEVDRCKPPLLLLLVLKLIEDNPEYVDVLNNLVASPDPKQEIPTYFSYMRQKMEIKKYAAARIFGLGKNAFSWIETGTRVPSRLLLMMFKIIEIDPAAFQKIKVLPDSRSRPGVRA